MLKKTRIIATIGPASESVEMLTKLMKAGVNVARLNFSHGDHAWHESTYRAVRKAAKEGGYTVAVMQDLMGPKIRIGDFATEFVTLKKGAVFTLTTKKGVGDETGAYITYTDLHKDVKKGDRVLLDDGKVAMTVEKISGTDVVCRIVIGGKIRGRRTVNVPGAYLSLSALTKKDKEDVAFGAKLGVDIVALSFVRTAQDVRDLKKLLKKHESKAKIMVKIETPEGVENIREITEEADAVMVARGDLAVEVPREDVPLIQKEIIGVCNSLGKPVVVATQMLETMITEANPTRAEVSDIAHAILEGADAIMLSAETGVGAYPVEAVEVMTRVAKKVEQKCDGRDIVRMPQVCGGREGCDHGIVDAMSESAVRIAKSVRAKAIIALTESGFTARMIARFRPQQELFAVTPNEMTMRQMELSFGCHARTIKPFTHVNDVRATMEEIVLREKIAKKGDTIVIAAGIPFGKAGGTNMVLVHVVGDGGGE
jgi:pyruvate kinase